MWKRHHVTKALGSEKCVLQGSLLQSLVVVVLLHIVSRLVHSGIFQPKFGSNKDKHWVKNVI